MNELINSNDLTMSSRELCDKINTFRCGAHQNEIRYFDFIIRVEDELDDLPPNETFVNPSNGKDTKFYTLTKDQMLLVGMRESKVIRKKVLSWINNFESKQLQPALPANYIEALESLVASEKEKAVLSEQLQIAKPAIAFVENYTKADTGSKGFRQVAKLLKVKENVFRAFLVENKIMYRLSGEWTAHANHIDAGRFEVTTGESNSHVHNTTKFTGKGIEWIAGLYAQSQIKTGEDK